MARAARWSPVASWLEDTQTLVPVPVLGCTSDGDAAVTADYRDVDSPSEAGDPPCRNARALGIPAW